MKKAPKKWSQNGPKTGKMGHFWTPKMAHFLTPKKAIFAQFRRSTPVQKLAIFGHQKRQKPVHGFWPFFPEIPDFCHHLCKFCPFLGSGTPSGRVWPALDRSWPAWPKPAKTGPGPVRDTTVFGIKMDPFWTGPGQTWSGPVPGWPFWPVWPKGPFWANPGQARPGPARPGPGH